MVIDESSRFPEVEIVPYTFAKSVLSKIEEIFSRPGIPATIKTDNVPPFNGEESANFLSSFWIHHREITPLWPEVNGEAEHFMATLNKTICTSVANCCLEVPATHFLSSQLRYPTSLHQNLFFSGIDLPQKENWPTRPTHHTTRSKMSGCR